MFSFLYNTPKFFELEVQPANFSFNLTEAEIFNNEYSLDDYDEYEQTDNFSIVPTDLRVHHLYVNIYLIYLNVIVTGSHIYILSIKRYYFVCPNPKKNILKSNSLI